MINIYLNIRWDIFILYIKPIFTHIMDLNSAKLQKPFLKWVGGKTQIIKQILMKFPTEINNYHEPFVGGGSVLFAILSLKQQNLININGQIFAYDINQSLINVYNHIKHHKDELMHFINYYMIQYHSLSSSNNGDNDINRKPKNIHEALTCKESFYYYMRYLYNTIDKSYDNIERSALFMCINKTCFRGMYREGPNGFNVPYGHYKKTPNIISQQDLDYISNMIQDVTFICCDFQTVLNDSSLHCGDFVYLDPPYAPQNSKSFVKYNADGFNIDEHIRLFDNIKNIGDSIRFVMSNSNVDLVTSTFEHYNCDVILARRAINSKNPESVTQEVIIYN